MPKYLKIYTGVTSGTLGGRDDGYPCDYHVTYDSAEEMAKTYGTRNNERYFELTPLQGKELHETIHEQLVIIKDKTVKAKEVTLEKQIEKLQKELKDLRK